MTFGKMFKLRPKRNETRRQKALREAREIERIPEGSRTKSEQATAEAYADFENNAYDRANDR